MLALFSSHHCAIVKIFSMPYCKAMCCKKLLILISILSYSSSDVLFYNNVSNVTSFDEYDLGAENETIVYLGDLENCSKFPFQYGISATYSRRIIIRQAADIDRACVYLDDEFPETGDSFLMDFNAIYDKYSTGGVGAFGNELRLASTPYYTIDLLTLNGNFGSSLGWLLSKLNLETNADRNRLFIIALNSLTFDNIYDRDLFMKIMESGQILKVILSRPSDDFPEAIVLPPAPEMYSLFVRCDNMQISLRFLHTGMNYTYRSLTYRFVFNFMDHEECVGGHCYSDCNQAPNNDSICIELPTKYALKFDGDVRHLKFLVESPCGARTNPRYSRSVENLPIWFVNYLLKNNMSKIDDTFFRNLESPLDYYQQVINPSMAIVYAFKYFYIGCVGDANFKSISTFPALKFKLSTKAGERLSLKNLAQCYHLITSDPLSKCMVLNVKPEPPFNSTITWGERDLMITLHSMPLGERKAFIQWSEEKTPTNTSSIDSAVTSTNTVDSTTSTKSPDTTENSVTAADDGADDGAGTEAGGE